MASNSQASLIQPDGLALASGSNSITSMWCDKRSATNVSLSFVLAGSNAPTGSVYVQASNAPENYNVTWGSGPLVATGSTTPVDTVTIPNSTVAITAVGATHWDIETPSRWVRIVYTASENVAGLTVYAFASVPFESP
jgi:hypothetical protein